MKLKFTIKTWAYSIVWSIVLFISTFPQLCLSGDIENFDALKTYLLPVGFILALYLWDEMYHVNSINLPAVKLKNIILQTFLFLGVSIIFIVIAIYYKDVKCIFFPLMILSWISISILKLISAGIVDNSSTELIKL